jgi:hypothetical protein
VLTTHDHYDQSDLDAFKSCRSDDTAVVPKKKPEPCAEETSATELAREQGLFLIGPGC